MIKKHSLQYLKVWVEKFDAHVLHEQMRMRNEEDIEEGSSSESKASDNTMER